MRKTAEHAGDAHLPISRGRTVQATDHSPQPADRRAWAIAIAVVVITGVSVWACAAQFGLGPVDDAYISLRFASNWVAGRGLCFNVGERVEGYTNSLLVAIQAAGIGLGISPDHLLSVLPTVGLVLLAGILSLFMSARLFPTRRALAATTALAIVLNPVLICWAASGLESCLYAMFLLASAALSFSSARRLRTIAAPIILLWAAMTRPEAVALFPVYLFFACFRPMTGPGEPPLRMRIPDAACFAGIFLGGLAIYCGLRVAYFGHLLPNTFYAKLDYGSGSLLERGMRYVGGFALAWPAPVVMVTAGCILGRRIPRWVRAFLIIAATQVAIVVYEGGDHFAMYRFAVPIIPFIGAAAAYYLKRVSDWAAQGCIPARRPARSLIVFTVGIALVFLSGLLVCRQPKPGETERQTQYARFLRECDYARQWSAIGRRLHDEAPPGSSIATVAIGAIGYYSDLRVIDPHGLIDPVIAHRHARLGSGYAGHEKFDVNRVFDQRPDYLLLVNTLTPEPVPSKAAPDRVWGEFNRAAMIDPRLADYRLCPISISGRWLNLHVRLDHAPAGAAAEESTRR